MPEVTHGESKALVIFEISDITKLDSLNRESYKIICMNSRPSVQVTQSRPILPMVIPPPVAFAKGKS